MENTNEEHRKWLMENYKNLGTLEPEEQTPELIEFAMNMDKNVFIHIHESNLTEELCVEAVKFNPYLLRSVPEELQTQTVIELALNQDKCLIKDVKNISKVTDEMVKKIVSTFGYLLEFIPEDKQTPEVIKLAIEEDGEALKHVKEISKFTNELSEISDELFKSVVKQDWKFLEYIPKVQQKQEHVDIAMKDNAYAYYHIKRDELKTVDWSVKAVMASNLFWSEVPSAIREEVKAKIEKG